MQDLLGHIIVPRVATGGRNGAGDDAAVSHDTLPVGKEEERETPPAGSYRTAKHLNAIGACRPSRAPGGLCISRLETVLYYWSRRTGTLTSKHT